MDIVFSCVHVGGNLVGEQEVCLQWDAQGQANPGLSGPRHNQPFVCLIGILQSRTLHRKCEHRTNFDR